MITEGAVEKWVEVPPRFEGRSQCLEMSILDQTEEESWAITGGFTVFIFGLSNTRTTRYIIPVENDISTTVHELIGR